MGKQSGLGQALYFNGVDISNLVGALSSVHGGPALFEATGLDKYAFERIGGLLDGAMDFAPWFDPAVAHPLLSAMAGTDIHAMFVMEPGAIGARAACIVAKQTDYGLTRGADAAMSVAVPTVANGYGLEHCEMLTAGKRTDTSATSGTGYDGGTQGPAINITSGSAANPTVVTTASPHGLATGASVVIAGTDKAALNGDWKVTVTGDSTYTVPVDLSGGAASGGTMTPTSTAQGLAAYLQTFSFTGTSNTPKLQHSADNGVNDSWADITGAAFAAISAGPDAQRIQTAAGVIIRRWVRLNSVGTFNPSTFSGAFTRHPIGATA